MFIKILSVVIVVELLAWFYILLRHDKDPAAVELYLAVWGAGVVDVACGVAAHGAVYHRAFVYLKEIFAAAGVVLLLRERPAAVLDDARAFLDRGVRKEPQARFGALYFEFMGAWFEFSRAHGCEALHYDIQHEFV